MTQLNYNSAYELIEKNKHKQIDESTRRAIMLVYGASRVYIDSAESTVILRTMYCRVQDVIKELELLGLHAKETDATIENHIESDADATAEVVESHNDVESHSDIEESIEHTDDIQANERLFKTTQNSIVVPTKTLIKQKNTDFRVLSAISVLSNVDDYTSRGENTRYASIRKVDKNMNDMCKAIGISSSQFRKHLRALLKHNTEEFKLVEREYNNNKVMCYEINYSAGEFVTIPVDKVEKLLMGLSNNCIKLYANLLWLCVSKNGEYIERELTQPYLLELMGLSKSTDKALKVATEVLEECKFIKTRKVWESETIIKNGMPVGSKPKSKIYYSIVL